MRKVTQEAAQALKDGRNYKSSNTEVRDGVLYLHGNIIARYMPQLSVLNISDADWRTNTTKERLNGILEVFGADAYINQSKGHWYVNTRNGQHYPWSGNLRVEVK